jgi:2-phospho-L-lactate guanylyltransferase (CobY/MobA/RfbA family)
MASRSGPWTVQCSAPDAVPLRFGENSFHPHLDAARARGIEPLIIRRPEIAMDIDHPVDLVRSCGCRRRSVPGRSPSRTIGHRQPSYDGGAGSS